MFSSLRNHTNNLQHSQRFYYNNYQYYNDLQHIETSYKDDLSKLYFRCHRKTQGKIISYRNNNQIQLREIQTQNINLKTMQKFINGFISIYNQNNYSDLKSNQNIRKQQFKIIYQNVSHQENQTKWNQFQEKILEKIQKVVENIHHQAQNSTNLEEYHQNCLILQVYHKGIIKNIYSNSADHPNSKQYIISGLRYRQLVSKIMEDIFTAKSYNILLLAQPNTPLYSQLIHPLVNGIDQFFSFKSNLNMKAKPKVVFINLDNKQNPHNLRTIRMLGSNLLYISIFDEPSRYECENISMEKEIELKQLSFNQLNELYSQLLIKQAYQRNNQDQNTKSKLLLFPLDSSYLKKQYLLKNEHKKKQKKFPRLQTSSDINFLFQSTIYQQIRSFNPTMILISYNGCLDLQQKYFNDIIRNLTILVDHKIVLFTNFTDLFSVPKDIVSCLENQDDPDYTSKIQVVKQFIQKYKSYTIGQVGSSKDNVIQSYEVNLERFYHNISMFLKISSGTYSLQQRNLQTSIGKYSMGKRYLYLQRLANFQQFSIVAKSSLRKWKGQQIDKLYKNYGKWQIKQNKKDNQNYQKIIDKIITQIKKQQNLPKKLQYHIKLLKRQYGYQQQQSQSQHQFNNYLQQQKQLLILENLQNYKIQKIFYVSSDDYMDSTKIKCYKFYMQNDISEQLQFQKYTQIIFDKQSRNVIIINYKSHDDKYLILHGARPDDPSSNIIQVSIIKQSQRENSLELKKQFQGYTIQEYQGPVFQGKNIIYVNYSHCYMGDLLYLFWPQKWSIEDQVRHKILKLSYNPESINKFLRISFKQGFQQIYLDENSQKITPRYGCSAWPVPNTRFYIFGGIYNTEKDFLQINSGINIVNIDNNSLKIQNLQKKVKNNYVNQNNKFLYKQCRLKPKINYNIKVIQGQNNKLLIFGGYGRQPTNFYNLFNYQSYKFSIQENKLEKIIQQAQFLAEKQKKNQQKQKKNLQQKQKRRLNFNGSFKIDSVGKFPIIVNDQNIDGIQQKFSDLPKNKFIFDVLTKKSQNIINKQIVAFIDDNYQINDYKIDHKKIYLFGFNRTVRQKLYTKFWSPQFFIISQNNTYIVNLSLKIQKNQQNISLGNFLIPRQDDLISVCLDQDKLYVLASSFILDIYIEGSNKIFLYEGSLANISQVMRKGQIYMFEKFEFKKQFQPNLQQKTILAIDQKVFLVGGYSQKTQNCYKRYDFILEKIKNKYKLKIKILKSLEDKLQLTSPVTIKNNDHYLLYSIIQEDVVNNQMAIENYQPIKKWKIKIQKFNQQFINQTKVITSQIIIYLAHPIKLTKIRIQPNLDNPKFIKIARYYRFQLNKFKQILQKVLIRTNKKSEKQQQLKNKIQQLKLIMQINDQNIIRKNIHQYIQYFKNFIKQIQQKQQNKKQDKTYQNQQFLYDLKNCYQILNKIILENIICNNINPQKQQYRFIIQDKLSKKNKYISIGQIGTTKLIFYKIRFKHQFSLCFNQSNDQDFFYHPTKNCCGQIQTNDKFYDTSKQEYKSEWKQQQRKIQISFNSDPYKN